MQMNPRIFGEIIIAVHLWRVLDALTRLVWEPKKKALIRRKEFLKLSKAQRDLILEEQAKALEKHYARSSDWDALETEEWQ